MIRKITALTVLTLLTGCASAYMAPPQTYRPRGQDDAVNIIGKAEKTDKILYHETKITIFFNGVPTISGYVDQKFNGELPGMDWNGKKTSASCSSIENRNSYDVRCMVFIDNERTVTLQF